MPSQKFADIFIRFQNPKTILNLILNEFYFSHETVSKLLHEGLNDKEIEISVVHSLEHTAGAYLNEAYENDNDDL